LDAESRADAARHLPSPETAPWAGAPRRVLTGRDAAAIIIGIVIGAGIFKAPSIIAANTTGEGTLLLAWLLGGLVSIAGALCYGELAGAYPHTGGEYHFLTHAYGRSAAFLFAWSRLTVLQTGSIALLAFVLGDYAAELLPLGPAGPALYAGATVVALTALNLAGLRTSTRVHTFATAAIVVGLLFVAVAGLLYEGAPRFESPPTDALQPAFGLAMVFVLLTYGGWNEAAYISAELRDARTGMVRVLVGSLGAIACIYLLVNLAYLNVLGLEGMRQSEVVTADAMRLVLGEAGARFAAALIAIAALTSINVSILTGARTNFALARDFPLFRFLGRWNDDTNTPTAALLVQGAITLLLVLVGALSRSGFQTMVEYVSPVFWLFFLLSAASLMVLRRRDPSRPRPFRVPLYPLTPLVFIATCAYMLYSSLAYTGFGALLGVAILGCGVPLLFFKDRKPATIRR